MYPGCVPAKSHFLDFVSHLTDIDFHPNAFILKSIHITLFYYAKTVHLKHLSALNLLYRIIQHWRVRQCSIHLESQLGGHSTLFQHSRVSCSSLLFSITQLPKYLNWSVWFSHATQFLCGTSTDTHDLSLSHVHFHSMPA